MVTRRRSIRRINEFRTDAGSKYTGLQTVIMKQVAGLTVQSNNTYSHYLDEISNGGLLPCSSLGIISPLPGTCAASSATATYDIRHNISGFAVYEVPSHSTNRLLNQTLGG